MDTIGILGAGAMGSGIAQVAAAYEVVICDNLTIALSKAGKLIQTSLKTSVEKGKLTDADAYSLFSPDPVYGSHERVPRMFDRDRSHCRGNRAKTNRFAKSMEAIVGANKRSSQAIPPPCPFPPWARS